LTVFASVLTHARAAGAATAVIATGLIVTLRQTPTEAIDARVPGGRLIVIVARGAVLSVGSRTVAGRHVACVVGAGVFIVTSDW